MRIYFHKIYVMIIEFMASLGSLFLLSSLFKIFKKIVVFFTLSIFGIILFLQHCLASYAFLEGNTQKMNTHFEQDEGIYMQGQIFDCHDQPNQNCEYKCCYSEKSFSSTSYQFKEQKHYLKIIGGSFIDISLTPLYSFENRNLLNQTSPPNIQRKIKYYTYANLTKIIKSNT